MAYTGGDATLDILGSTLGGAATGAVVGGTLGLGIGAVPGAIGGAVVGLGMGIGAAVGTKKHADAIEAELERLRREYEKQQVDAEEVSKKMLEDEIVAYNTRSSQEQSDAKAKAMINAEMSGLTPAGIHAASIEAEQKVAESYGLNAPTVYRQAQQNALAYLEGAKSSSLTEYQIELGLVQTEYPDYFKEIGSAMGSVSETATAMGAAEELETEATKGTEGGTAGAGASARATGATEGDDGAALGGAEMSQWAPGARTTPEYKESELAWMDSPEAQQLIAAGEAKAGQEFLRQRSDPWGIKETEPAAGYKEGGVVGEKGPERVTVGEGGEEEVIIPMSKLAKALGTEGAQLMASSVEGDPNQQMSAIRTYLNRAAVEEELASKSTVPGEKQSARYRSERAEQEGRPDIAADSLAQMRADPSYKKGYAEAWEHYSNNPSEVSLDTRFPAKARRGLHPTEAKGILKDEPYLLAYSEVLEEMRRRAEEEDEERMEASRKRRGSK